MPRETPHPVASRRCFASPRDCHPLPQGERVSMTGRAMSFTHEPNRASVMAMTAELQATQPTETAAPVTPAARLRRLARPLLGLVLPLLLAGGWELVVYFGWSNGRLVPPPSRIISTIAGLARTGELSRHIGVTLARVGIGFGLGVAAGTLMGGICGYWAMARRLID